jgi:hypothetical protein
MSLADRPAECVLAFVATDLLLEVLRRATLLSFKNAPRRVRVFQREVHQYIEVPK